MTDEIQAAELPRQDDAFQMAVEEHVREMTAIVRPYGGTGIAEDITQLELERATWDFAATWTALLEEHNNPEQLEEQAQP